MAIHGFVDQNGAVQKYDYASLENVPTDLVKDADLDVVIAVQDTEPEDDKTKLWIKETSSGGVQVPTYEEFLEAIGSLEAIPHNVKMAMDTLFSKAAYADDDAASSYATFHAWATANPVTSIAAVFTQGSATIYDTDSLDTLRQYLTVTATFSDSTTATVTDYTLSGTLAEGTSTITVSYGGKTDTFDVSVTKSPLWVFTNGIMALIGSDSTAGLVYRQAVSARACGSAPIVNNGYIFTVTDSTKYNLAAAGVTSLEHISISATAAIDRYGYPASNETFAWAASASVAAPYVWLSLKKMDNTAFTSEELANGAAAVFTYTEAT